MINPLLIFILAMAISMAVIPVMIRLAPRFGMIDKPDPRKVHKTPIPRVGGWGIVLGSLIAVVLLVQPDQMLRAYVIGALILFVVGVLDDIFELGHYPKFLGQIVAVLVVILYGGLWVGHMPYLGLQGWSPAWGIPFTAFAMIGMINAINHSDGLDGLAAGESLLSLIVMLFLAYIADGEVMVALSAAVLGGTLGFLRFNTHPARVFMGDSGSTFLGFTVAFLVILLTQHVHTALSPALPLLLLGLPIVDIIAVLIQRIYQKKNWFKATRNHIHHRLLDLGFDHYETVVIIYSIQALLVISAIFLRYENDYLITLFYLLVCTGVFGGLILAERNGWRAHALHETSRVTRLVYWLKNSERLRNASFILVAVAIPVYFIIGISWIRDVPEDFGYVSVALMLVLLLDIFLHRERITLASHAVIAVTALFVAYLSSHAELPWLAMQTLDLVYFGVVALTIALIVRFHSDQAFGATPLDYLMVFVVVTIALFSTRYLQIREISMIVGKGMVLLYACEFLLGRMRQSINSLSIASVLALVIMGVKGLG